MPQELYLEDTIRNKKITRVYVLPDPRGIQTQLQQITKLNNEVTQFINGRPSEIFTRDGDPLTKIVVENIT
jgi:hypothetical protein